MTIVTNDWSVVVVGHWNRAILTPAGIAKRLFGLDGSVPLEVLIPLDEYGPYQVKHQNVIVVAGSDRLVLQAVPCKFSSLNEAKTIAASALHQLPHTPFFAAGLNLGFETVESIGELESLMSHPGDGALSDCFTIKRRQIKRTVDWGGESVVNIEVLNEEDKFKIKINFELRSKDDEKLSNFLNIPIETFEKDARMILTNYIGIIDKDLVNVI